MVVIGLGGNLADPRRRLCRTLEALAALPDTRLVGHSDLYASAPVGPQDQPQWRFVSDSSSADPGAGRWRLGVWI